MKKQVLTYQQIMDYIQCPMIYVFKHIDKLPYKDFETLHDRSYNAIKDTLLYYYSVLKDGNSLSIEQLTNKFGKLFSKSSKIGDIMEQNNLNNRNISLTYDSIQILKKIYENDVNKKFTPLLVNYNLTTHIGEYDILTNIDYVREVKEGRKKRIEIVNYLPYKFSYDKFYVSNHMESTLQSYALQQTFGKCDYKICLTNFKLNYEYLIDKEESHFNEMIALVNTIGGLIKDKKFYRINQTKCSTCKYKPYCDKYKF